MVHDDDTKKLVKKTVKEVFGSEEPVLRPILSDVARQVIDNGETWKVQKVFEAIREIRSIINPYHSDEPTHIEHAKHYLKETPSMWVDTESRLWAFPPNEDWAGNRRWPVFVERSREAARLYLDQTDFVNIQVEHSLIHSLIYCSLLEHAEDQRSDLGFLMGVKGEHNELYGIEDPPTIAELEDKATVKLLKSFVFILLISAAAAGFIGAGSNWMLGTGFGISIAALICSIVTIYFDYQKMLPTAFSPTQKPAVLVRDMKRLESLLDTTRFELPPPAALHAELRQTRRATKINWPPELWSLIVRAEQQCPWQYDVLGIYPRSDLFGTELQKE